MPNQMPLPPTFMTAPNVARMYDYFLGGKENFATDRAMAEKVLRLVPQARTFARLNREFLVRTVRFLAGEVGITQFIDIGSGLPARHYVHEVAQQINPGARVVYVDNDPMVLVHARALLAINAITRVADADLRKPSSIVGHRDVLDLIDWSRPVAVLPKSRAPPGTAQLPLSERRIMRMSPASLVTTTLTDGMRLFGAGACGSS